MENKFLEVMSKKTDKELLKVVTELKYDYQPEAVIAAALELQKRNINNDICEETIKELKLKSIKDEKNSQKQTKIKIKVTEPIVKGFSIKTLIVSVIVVSFLGGVASGYFGFINDIASVDFLIIPLWYLILPISVFIISFNQSNLFSKKNVIIFLSPIYSLTGFWFVYRHPDLISSGFPFSFTAIAFSLIIFIIGKLYWKRKQSKTQILVMLFKIYIVIAFSCGLAAIVYVCVPQKVQYEIVSMDHPGKGIINSSKTDTYNSSNGRGYYCDQAVLEDMLSSLKGYSGLKEIIQMPRRNLMGPLLKLFPYRDSSVYGIYK